MKNKRDIFIGRPFSLFLAGQGILSFGEAVRFIAVTVLMYDITGSGVSTAAGIALSTLPGILISPFAGVAGDRSGRAKRLVLMDGFRSLAALLFIFAENITHIYLLLILISVSDVFYNPSRRKYVQEITGKKGAFRANSMLTGAGGAAYLAGPVLAGFLTEEYGPVPLIFLASACCLISALLTGSSIAAVSMKSSTIRKPDSHEAAMSCLREGIRYCRAVPAIRELLAAGFVLGFCTLSVNLAFYPFAFDMLNVTPKGWGLLITVYYGADLFAMFIAGQMEAGSGKHSSAVFYGSIAATASIWLIYAFVKGYAVVLLLQFAEGTFMAICGIILAARCQITSDREYMARVVALSDMTNGIGKLMGMGVTSCIAVRFSCIGVFVFCSAFLLIFAAIGSIHSGRTPDRKSSRPVVQ